MSGDDVRKLIEECLREGLTIEIDGRGSFELDVEKQLVFRRNNRISIFLAYAEEDRPAMRRLYKGLDEAGFAPWMDKEKLLPGQNWPRAVERAIEMSDFFVACFSSKSSNKRGHFQSELSYALEIAKRVPIDEAFIVPVRLNSCAMPDHISRKIHYVDLYPDWNTGLTKLIRALRHLQRKRKRGENLP